MSYTTINDISKNIINKKVLFIDLKTIGQIKETNSNYIKQEEKYPNYKKNELYNEARIIQFGWIYLEDFDYEYEITPENISIQIVKPEGFIIPEETIKIHKITNEIANEKGKNIKKILKKFIDIFNNVEYIIGYNIYFDINILLNELYKLKMENSIKKIKNLIKDKKILCIGELACQYKGYKTGMPKQTKIYAELIGKDLENAHDAKYNICGTIELMYWFNSNIKIFFSNVEENIAKNIIKEVDKLNIDELNNQNYGQKWYDDEYELLLNEIDENKTINEICIEHKRNFGGIKSGIKRLITKHPNNQKIINYYKNIFETTNNNNNNNNDINNEKVIKENFPNIGKKWSNNEYNMLKNEINEKKSLEEICENHGRYKGGIKKAIKRLVDKKEIKFNDELKNKYSIKICQNIDEDENEDENENENEDDNNNESYEEIIGILVKKIENLKNKNKILKEENMILKSKTNYIKLYDDELL